MAKDPTIEICAMAASYPKVTIRKCSGEIIYKIRYRRPPKGIARPNMHRGPSFFQINTTAPDFVAKFKLEDSLDQFEQLAIRFPSRYVKDPNGWATVRFTKKHPLLESLWRPWLDESHDVVNKWDLARNKEIRFRLGTAVRKKK